MQNAYSPVHGNAARLTTDAPLPSSVILTSVLTETEHPTWVVTETVAGNTVTTILQPETIPSDSVDSQPQFKTTRLETATLSSIPSQTIQSVTTTANPSPTTTSTQSVEDRPVSSTSETPVLLVHTSTHSSQEQSLLASSSSPSTSSPSSTWPTTSRSWPGSDAPQRTTTSSLASSLSSTTSPVTSSETGAFSEATNSGKSSEQSESRLHRVGTIIGSAIGGATFVALSLLACFFFFRRRRRLTQRQRKRSQQRLLRDSDSIISFHDLHQLPPLPVICDPSTPSARARSHRRQSGLPDPRPNPSSGAQDPLPDQMCLHADPSPDLEKSPAFPIIHISPPSRSASIYSRASWERRMDGLEYTDSPRNSQYENTYYSGSPSTLPSDDSRRASKCLDTTRDSRRSNPFDLEPPPHALYK
ncbi:hypothetical protein N7492_002082 [Penicillium capsulatum]|uniref:Mid2 domain-containing protein n=1 Tax=Penicillium capsulatum TaxID=69766 RepID=A0A9W9IJD3_9EURO|nr:hypothetical protein N7492_002082 [Penicillium capsulatum]KAJ6123304.1 hypothetical protein N7512_005769 [Penicillium capsulatum]